MPGPAAEGTAGPTVRFAGLTWAVKVADPPVGPGPNRYTTARSGRGRHAISWSPGRVQLSSAVGDQVHSWTLSGPAVPPAGGGVAPRMNLWQFRGRAPRRPQAVTVTNFSYRPWS